MTNHFFLLDDHSLGGRRTVLVAARLDAGCAGRRSTAAAALLLRLAASPGVLSRPSSDLVESHDRFCISSRTEGGLGQWARRRKGAVPAALILTRRRGSSYQFS